VEERLIDPVETVAEDEESPAMAGHEKSAEEKEHSSVSRLLLLGIFAYFSLAGGNNAHG
jgi:hypothetical protein